MEFDITSIFRKTTVPKNQVSSVEAFNIWNSLRARYISIEKNQLLGNFAHDASLKNLMDIDLKL